MENVVLNATYAGTDVLMILFDAFGNEAQSSIFTIQPSCASPSSFLLRSATDATATATTADNSCLQTCP